MSIAGIPLTASRPRTLAGGAAVRLFDRLLDWQDRARQRRHLSCLDDHLLSDVGLGRGDIESEVRKPFWRL
jgi:uncharacterized protein YjiS (DUF1127 family)